MKEIRELYNEIIKDENLRNEFIGIKIDNEKKAIEKFLRDHDCDATYEEAIEFIKQEFVNGKISDEELKAITAGEKTKAAEIVGSIFSGGLSCGIRAAVSAQKKLDHKFTYENPKDLICNWKDF